MKLRVAQNGMPWLAVVISDRCLPVPALKCISLVWNKFDHSKPIPFWNLQSMSCPVQNGPKKNSKYLKRYRALEKGSIFSVFWHRISSALLVILLWTVLRHPGGERFRNLWNFGDPITSRSRETSRDTKIVINYYSNWWLFQMSVSD